MTKIIENNDIEIISEVPVEKKKREYSGYLRKSNKNKEKTSEELLDVVETTQDKSSNEVVTEDVKPSALHSDNTIKTEKNLIDKSSPEYANLNNPNHPSYQGKPKDQKNVLKKQKPTPYTAHSTHKNSKKINPHFKRHEDSEIHWEEDNFPSVLFSKENMLISYMRQKSGFNPVSFWQDLHALLEEKPFEQIQNNQMSLISYAVIYSKESIFSHLLENFGHLLPQEEFEQTIFTFCMNRNVSFLNESLSFYEKHFSITEEFINSIIQKSAKSSYREDNNYALLNWLEPKLNEQNISLFWDKCLDERNIVLLEQALHYKKLHQYLYVHYEQYQTKITELSRNYSVEKSFRQPNYNIDSLKFTSSSILDLDVSLSSTLFKNTKKEENRLQPIKSLSSKSEISQPEITIRKRKKLQ